MLPASNRGAGMNVGFPDVCATPPLGAPIPYPNMAMNATAVPFAIKTFFSCVNALNMGSAAPLTLGDQAGTMSPFMGPGRCTMGNPVVNVEGLPATNLLCPTTGNNMVNALGVVAVPSVTNVFFTRAGAAPQGAVDAAALAALPRALQPPPGAEAAALLPGGVAYAAVPVFSSDLPSRLHDVLRRAHGAAALVLDLRGCPGGDLRAALDLASDFLPEGTILATVIDGDDDETVYRSPCERPHALPLAILVDRHTASAAEVFAGCLKAHGRAVVIGERTYGKGTAQALVPGFAEPGAAYLTVARVVLPDGSPIEGRGVSPDLDVAAAPPPAADDAHSPDRLVAEPAIAAALAALRASPPAG